jgi:hypothetical protein
VSMPNSIGLDMLALRGASPASSVSCRAAGTFLLTQTPA